MSVTRRDFFRVCGGTAAALGLSKFKPFGVLAAEPGNVKIYAFICGILKTHTQLLLKDTRVGVPFDIPVPFFLIKHGGSWVAFDTGNNIGAAEDPVKYWGKAVSEAYYPVMKPYEEFKIQIKKIGLAPKDFKCAILSHGHLDHAGAIDNFVGTDVPLYFQKEELKVIKECVECDKKSAYIPDDFKTMNKLNIKGIDGVFDVFGDQTVVAFPTPGHTPGHQSLFVKTGNGKNMILTQDACYTLENMVAAIPPGLFWKIPQAMEALYTFKIMQFMGGQIVPAHDPDFWKNKPLGPETFNYLG